tara:strand:- start:2218 stop:2697 length:480 start_codon:yes stop_codon:yes gene_type:complete
MELKQDEWNVIERETRNKLSDAIYERDPNVTRDALTQHYTRSRDLGMNWVDIGEWMITRIEGRVPWESRAGYFNTTVIDELLMRSTPSPLLEEHPGKCQLDLMTDEEAKEAVEGLQGHLDSYLGSEVRAGNHSGFVDQMRSMIASDRKYLSDQGRNVFD